MDAAVDHVAEVGFTAASIRAIAEKAGITSGALYHYFPSKVELVTAAAKRQVDEAMARIEAAAVGETTLAGAIVALLEEGVRIVADHPRMTRFTAAITAESATHDAVAEVLLDLRRRQEQLFCGLVKEAAASGELAADADPQAVVDMLVGITHGLTYISATSSLERHRAALRATESLLLGRLLPKPRRPRRA